VRIYAPFDREETWHRTSADGVDVTWKIAGGEARVMFVQPGDHCFPADAYPTLTEARERLPEFGHHWDLIHQELVDNLGSPSSATRQHAEFFSLPH